MRFSRQEIDCHNLSSVHSNLLSHSRFNLEFFSTDMVTVLVTVEFIPSCSYVKICEKLKTLLQCRI